MIGVAFHPSAAAELESSALYYERQQFGLGRRFTAAVELALAGIVDAPTTWPVLESGIRRKLLRVFPFALLYSVDADQILILAVMHCQQQPGYWRTRLPTNTP